MKPLSLTALASACAAVGAIVGVTPACGVLFLDGRPCPCATGWICCEGVNVCVDDPTKCSTSPSSTSDAVTPGSVTLADGQTPQCMTQDSEHLYWLNVDSRLAAVDKRGGPVVFSHWVAPPQPLLDGLANREQPCGLATSGKYIYATMRGLGQIAKISLETNGAWDLGNEGYLFGALSSPRSLVVDDQFVYVTEFDTALIKKYPHGGDAVGSPDGGAASDAGDAGPGANGATGLTNVAIFERRVGDQPAWLVADADFLYWFDHSGLRKMSKAGDAVFTLVAPSAPPAGSAPPPTTVSLGTGLAMSGGWLYSLGGQWVEGLPATGGQEADVHWPDADTYRHLSDDLAEDGSNWAELERQEDEASEGCLGTSANPDLSDEPVETKTTSSGQPSPMALGADAREAVFASLIRMSRVPAGGTSSSSDFVYRDRCADKSTVAQIILLDDARIFWADQTRIWSHPR